MRVDYTHGVRNSSIYNMRVYNICFFLLLKGIDLVHLFVNSETETLLYLDNPCRHWQGTK